MKAVHFLSRVFEGIINIKTPQNIRRLEMDMFALFGIGIFDWLSIFRHSLSSDTTDFAKYYPSSSKWC